METQTQNKVQEAFNYIKELALTKIAISGSIEETTKIAVGVKEALRIIEEELFQELG
jgi:thioredoxin-related protein